MEDKKQFDMRARQFRAEGRFFDPAPVLLEMRRLQSEAVANGPTEEDRNLGARRIQEISEMRQGLLFCYAMSVRLERPVYFARIEQADYDGIAYWPDGDCARFSPIQLKEVPPQQLNPAACLQDVLNGLEKYVDSADLVVAVHVNQVGTITTGELVAPKTKLGGLWIFLATNPDQTEWVLYGDLQDSAQSETFFRYPE